jgi:hypothetical protein
LSQASSRRAVTRPVLRIGWLIAVRIRTLAENQLHWLETGRNPSNGSRQRNPRSNAQPEGSFARLAHAILPLLAGGFLPRTSIFSTEGNEDNEALFGFFVSVVCSCSNHVPNSERKNHED